jgi:hypothetical protein
MRGRLIFPFLVDIYRLDADGTNDPPGVGGLPSGYDSVYQEPLVLPGGTGHDEGTSARKELAAIRISAQVEPVSWQALQEMLNGDSSRSEFTLVFHYRDIEASSMVGTNGGALIKRGDRLGAIYKMDGTLVQTVPNPPGLFVTESRSAGFGLSMGSSWRNLLICVFHSREQGASS